MASEPEGQGLPDAAEQVHLPEPSYLPVVTAFAITLILVGVVLNWVITIIGAVLLVPVVWRWIASTRSDISELPLEH